MYYVMHASAPSLHICLYIYNMLTFTIDTTFVCVGSDHNVKRSHKKLATSAPPISSMFSILC